MNFINDTELLAQVDDFEATQSAVINFNALVGAASLTFSNVYPDVEERFEDVPYGDFGFYVDDFSERGEFGIPTPMDTTIFADGNPEN